MKWGVRKDRNRSPRKRAKAQGPTYRQKHRQVKEAKYIQKGLTPEEATRRYNRVQATKKILAITGAVAVATVGAVVAKDYHAKQFVGVHLEAGHTLKYINDWGEKANFDRRLYTTFQEKDTQKYRGLLFFHLRKTQAVSRDIFETSMQATEAIKAPSNAEAAKLYRDYLQTPGAKKDLAVRLFEARRRGLVSNTARYRAFNLSLAIKDDHPFFDYVRKHGYNALLDTNDQFASGYDAKKPLILLNASKQAKVTTHKILEEAKSLELYKRQMAGLYGRAVGETMAKYGAIGAAWVGVSKRLDTTRRYAAVDKYLAEHPNSEYSRNELYAKLERDRKGKYSIAP